MNLYIDGSFYSSPFQVSVLLLLEQNPKSSYLIIEFPEVGEAH